MSVTLFITLLMAFSLITSICTEGCKKLFDSVGIKYSSNVIVFIIACIVGVLGTGIYYVIFSIEFNIVNIICMFLMGISSTVGAMIGYDKVVQTIKQLNIK